MEKRVGFGLRLGAYLIDLIVIVVVSYILQFALFPRESMPTSMAAQLTSISYIASVVFTLLYFLIEGFAGATPGKMILKLKVGTPGGQAGSRGLYLLRFAIKNVTGLVFILAILFLLVAPGVGLSLVRLGYIVGLIFFIGCFLTLRGSKQALHDMIAKTAVYRTSDLGAGG